jgi:hypothetical protein
LGKKKTAPPKKAPAPAPSPEDDIFASMGLAAKPKFSHAPPATRTSPPVSASRWGAATTSSNTFAAATPSNTFAATTTTNSFDDAGDDDDNWGDDDTDLDDLLNM